MGMRGGEGGGRACDETHLSLKLMLQPQLNEKVCIHALREMTSHPSQSWEVISISQSATAAIGNLMAPADGTFLQGGEATKPSKLNCLLWRRATTRV